MMSCTNYSKTCLKWPLKKKTKTWFSRQCDRLSLNAGQTYCRMLQGQYFRPSLSDHLSLRSLFCLLLSGRIRQVLLYITVMEINFIIGNYTFNFCAYSQFLYSMKPDWNPKRYII